MMLTVNPMASSPDYVPGPLVMIPFTLNPAQSFASQTVPNGTTVVRPSDGTQWVVVNTYPWSTQSVPTNWPTSGYTDRIVLLLSLVTAPTSPVQVILVTDTLNILVGSQAASLSGQAAVTALAS